MTQKRGKFETLLCHRPRLSSAPFCPAPDYNYHNYHSFSSPRATAAPTTNLTKALSDTREQATPQMPPLLSCRNSLTKKTRPKDKRQKTTKDATRHTTKAAMRKATAGQTHAHTHTAATAQHSTLQHSTPCAKERCAAASKPRPPRPPPRPCSSASEASRPLGRP